jgi:hypothetical protein
MNSVYVEGSTKKKRELAESIINYCIDTLLPRYRTLDIELNLTKPEGAQGYCCSLSNREFELEIDKTLEGEDFITCITHEMVHVWQYATGTLKQTYGGKSFWKGKEYTDTSYSKQPWERQAYRMQETLLQGWKEFAGTA